MPGIDWRRFCGAGLVPARPPSNGGNSPNMKYSDSRFTAQTIETRDEVPPPVKGAGARSSAHSGIGTTSSSGQILLSSIGTWMQVIAQGWLVRDLTPSLSIGSGIIRRLVSTARLLALQRCLCRPLQPSQAADRHSGRSDGLCLRSALVSLGLINIWQVIMISFVNGLAATLASPTYQALTLDLVGREISSAPLPSTQLSSTSPASLGRRSEASLSAR